MLQATRSHKWFVASNHLIPGPKFIHLKRLSHSNVTQQLQDLRPSAFRQWPTSLADEIKPSLMILSFPHQPLTVIFAQSYNICGKILRSCISASPLRAWWRLRPLFALSLNFFFFFRSCIWMLPHITSKCNTRDLLPSPRARLNLFLEPHHHLLPSSRDVIRLMLTLVCMGGFQCQHAHCTVPRRQLWVNTCCDTLLERPWGVCTPQWALWRRKERLNCAGLCACCLCARRRWRGTDCKKYT